MNRQTSLDKEITDVDVYTFQLPQLQQEIVQHLRAFIAQEYHELVEALRWHVPVYSLNGTSHLLGIQVFKRQVNLNFFQGAHLYDPHGILKGSGKQVRHITLARVLIAEYNNNRIEHTVLDALRFLERLLRAAEEGKRTGSVIEILILQTLAHSARGNKPQAFAALKRALTLAEPKGYMRIFVAEEKPMAELLAVCYGRKTVRFSVDVTMLKQKLKA